jgi:hypothetical protein
VIRSDFPGGWEGDAVNAFTGEGLTSQQKEAQQFIADLAHLRRQSCALNMGEMLHYIPLGEVYVYFKSFGDEHKMIVLNRNDEEVELGLDRFQQGLEGFTRMDNVWTGEVEEIGSTLTLAPMGSYIFDLK